MENFRLDLIPPPSAFNHESLVGEYATDNNDHRLSLYDNGLYHLVRASDNLELRGQYCINEFGFLILGTNPNRSIELRIEINSYARVIRLVDPQYTFNRVTEPEDL